MKIVYHPDFRRVYCGDPASEPGRLDLAAELLHERFGLVQPEPATTAQLARVHTRNHIESVESRGQLGHIATLAAGAALEAAWLSLDGEPTFALLRPPGHHASPGSSWGFCYFNNIAIAIEDLLEEASSGVRRALILDIDLHFGDGTASIFGGRSEVKYFHPDGDTGEVFLTQCAEALAAARDTDIIAVSAGFDRHLDDWGGLLTSDDYESIGGMVRDQAIAHCGGRCFAVLEGGYNHESLAESALALCQGLDGEPGRD